MLSFRKYCLVEFWVFWMLIAGMMMGCEEELPDVKIPQFRNPQDVTLVCYDDVLGPLPIDSCKNSERTDAEIYAFVTQTEYGEVAVVNLEDYKIVDQEERIPFNSFVPVGGSPQDIIASSDGSKVYTANFETRDISVVDVTSAIRGVKNEETGIYSNRLSPAKSIDVVYPAVQIVVVEDVAGASSGTSAIQDKFAFVTQPTVGRVAVVNLETYTVQSETGDFEVPPGVLAYLRLDDGTLGGEQDNRPGGVDPYSMVASKRIASLYVGGRSGGVNKNDGSYVVEIQREILVDRAKRSYEENRQALPLDPSEMIIRRMELQEFTVRDMSIEPELERWMYIVENERGGVVVLDLESGELLDINSWDIAAKDSYSLELPGIAQKVKLARFGETVPTNEEPGPSTFNGTIAVVSTTQASIFIVDVAIDDSIAADVTDFEFYPHSLRSSTAWFETADNDGVRVLSYPEVAGDVELWGDEDLLQHEDSPFVALVEDTGDNSRDMVGRCGEDPTGYRVVQTDDTQNVYFRCDRRISTTERWYLVYQGQVGISGDATLENTDMAGTAVMVDRDKNFCASGLLGPAGADIWGAYPQGGRDMDAIGGTVANAGQFERFRGYPGDIIEITSEPVPFIPNTDCSIYKKKEIKKWYQVDEIIGNDEIRIKAIEPFEDDSSEYAPLPTEECFGQAFTYTVRARNSWVLKGSTTHVLSEGMMLNGNCVPWTEKLNDGRNSSRVFEGADFENKYLKFRFTPQFDLGRDVTKDSFDNLRFEFVAQNGFTPMRSIVGSDITDIEIAPNNNVVIIDQFSNGMVLFDLIDEFSQIDKPIN